MIVIAQCALPLYIYLYFHLRFIFIYCNASFLKDRFTITILDISLSVIEEWHIGKHYAITGDDAPGEKNLLNKRSREHRDRMIHEYRPSSSRWPPLWAWCIHPTVSVSPCLPPANNVQPSRRILFCPITSISERTGADVIEFHQVANFALFSTLRQPSPGAASFIQDRCLLYLRFPPRVFIS